MYTNKKTSSLRPTRPTPDSGFPSDYDSDYDSQHNSDYDSETRVILWHPQQVNNKVHHKIHNKISKAISNTLPKMIPNTIPIFCWMAHQRRVHRSVVGRGGHHSAVKGLHGGHVLERNAHRVPRKPLQQQKARTFGREGGKEVRHTY